MQKTMQAKAQLLSQSNENEMVIEVRFWWWTPLGLRLHPVNTRPCKPWWQGDQQGSCNIESSHRAVAKGSCTSQLPACRLGPSGALIEFPLLHPIPHALNPANPRTQSQELGRLDEDSNVFKLIGPALIKQARPIRRDPSQCSAPLADNAAPGRAAACHAAVQATALNVNAVAAQRPPHFAVA
jgi:hypothetical protein